MHRYRLHISYDGTNYCGWQVQPHAVSIQSLVQHALLVVLRTPTHCTGAGRTDAGVHAKGQIAHFDAVQELDPKRLRLSLNALLPADVRIMHVDAVAPQFHARYNAIAKIYHYHLHLDKVIDPFVRLYRCPVFLPCSLSSIAQALPYFVGTHDFFSFANKGASGCASRNAVRTLHRLDLVEQPGGVRFEFEANGFLYKMVRNIMGTLLEIGAGKLSIEQIPKIFSAKKRACAPTTAPPQGLFLMHVRYPEEFSTQEV